jgi:hypothetical protein
LLLALLPQRSLAGGGGGGDAADGRWWCDEQGCHNSDYSYVETVIVIVLVIMAVLFEAAHHMIEHKADASYFYGKLQSVAPETLLKGHIHNPHGLSAKIRTPLFKHWVDRLSKEFMVLGFLAFFVFVFREVGGFGWMVDLMPPTESHSVKLPKSAEDWLHMVENVHMKLFLGMTIYFLVILFVVNGCVKHVEFWEEMRILRRSSKIENVDDVSRTASCPEEQTRLSRYGRWRMYFVQSVVRWRETRPKLYQETLQRLRMYSGDTPSQRRFHRALDDVFPFSAYLAYAVRECCKDTVDVHYSTWAAVLVLFGIFAIIQRYAKLILLHFMPIFIVVAFIFVFAVGRVVMSFRERVESAGSLVVHMNLATEQAERIANQSHDLERGFSLDSKGQDEEPAEGFHERYPTELWVFRVLQIVLFVLSYSCARTIGDPNDWRHSPKEVLAISSGFLVLFLVLGSLLPKHVPIFAALMAMPPYVDSGNVRMFFEVLEEYNTYHEDHHNVELKDPPSVAWKKDCIKLPLKIDEESSDMKKACARFEVLTAQQEKLSCEVREMQASLQLCKCDLSDAMQPVHAPAKLTCELGMIRVQLERLENLVLQSHSCLPHQPPPVHTSSCAVDLIDSGLEASGGNISNSEEDDGPRGVPTRKKQRHCTFDNKDLVFFIDPQTSLT